MYWVWLLTSVDIGWPSGTRDLRHRSLTRELRVLLVDRQPIRMAHVVVLTLHHTEQLFISNAVRKDDPSHPFYVVPRVRNGTSGEGTIFPLFKNKKITLAVATRGCSRSHSLSYRTRKNK